jgi:hypothetical protein
MNTLCLTTRPVVASATFSEVPRLRAGCRTASVQMPAAGYIISAALKAWSLLAWKAVA